MNIEIANRLYEYRKANGFSQEELAEKIGVSRQAISKWERSESSPDTDNLIALAKLYNVSLDEMINGESAPSKAAEAPAEPPAAEAPTENAAPAQDHVNISMRGLDVQSKEGDNVHIGLDGIRVNPGAQQQPFNASAPTYVQAPKKKAPWVDALVWLGGLILFLLVGAVFPSGWSVSWIILLLLPAITTGIDAVAENNANKFAYPLLVVSLFCALGMGFGVWHPAWILFLTIPIYYIIVDSLKKSRADQPATGKSPLFITFAIIFGILMCSTFGIVCHTAMDGRSHGGTSSSIGHIINYDNEDAYTIGGATLPAQEVNAVQVDWIGGSVTVSPATDDSNTITFSESQPENEDLALRYLVENGTLKIRFCKAHLSRKDLKNSQKKLQITVPQTMLNKLKFDTVSADVNVTVDAAALDIDNVSGDITATGAYQNVDIDNVSGDVVLTNTAANSRLDMDTVSGNCTLSLPQDIGGFSVRYDTVSGDADCQGFHAVKDTTEKVLTYGNAGSTIEFDSVSGDLLITAAES